MKLQPKKAIQADLATQRKAQIDEGVKIASKVDTVRETLAQEEGNLRRFRQETIASVQADIDRYIGVKDTLKSEIVVLERQKSNAQIPLNAEWERLRKDRSKLVKDIDAWGGKSDNLKEREDQVERSEREAEVSRGKASEMLHKASEKFAQADAALQEARESAASIRNKAQVVLSAAESIERENTIKEQELERREATILVDTARNRANEVDLAARELALKDKYKTLERTIKRINHG